LICDAKICMITFLDDKTHYISHELSPEPWLSHVPMGRSAGMCPHTILKRTGEVFEVPDTQEDWRFRGKVSPFMLMLIVAFRHWSSLSTVLRRCSTSNEI
jgi:hypothetical protein